MEDSVPGLWHCPGIEADKAELAKLMHFATDDVETYQQFKGSSAQTTTAVASTAAAIAASSTPVGWAAALMKGALYGGVGALGANVAIQGQGYGWQEAYSDVLQGAVEGAVGNSGLGEKVLGKALNMTGFGAKAGASVAGKTVAKVGRAR